MKNFALRVAETVALAVVCVNCMGAIWSIYTPADNSSRPKGANVAGTGTISEAGQSGGVFKFGTYNTETPVEFILENENGVTVTSYMGMNSWNWTLAPPNGENGNNFWKVSPKSMMGTYIGDHVALLEHPGGSAQTSQHVVRDE